MSARLKPIAPEFTAYTSATPSDQVARLAGIDTPQAVRYDQQPPPLPPHAPRPGVLAQGVDHRATDPPLGKGL